MPQRGTISLWDNEGQDSCPIWQLQLVFLFSFTSLWWINTNVLVGFAVPPSQYRGCVNCCVPHGSTTSEQTSLWEGLRRTSWLSVLLTQNKGTTQLDFVKCYCIKLFHSNLNRKRVDSTSQTLVNGVVEVNAASNNRALTHVTFAQRPTSAASDVASVSDGNSLMIIQLTCVI